MVIKFSIPFGDLSCHESMFIYIILMLSVCVCLCRRLLRQYFKKEILPKEKCYSDLVILLRFETSHVGPFERRISSKFQEQLNRCVTD